MSESKKFPTSGYGLFMSESSKYPHLLSAAEEELRKELKNPDEKLSQFKIVSKAWNSMEEELKQQFKERAEKHRESAPNEAEAENQTELISHKKKDFVFRLGAIKRIVKNDPEVAMIAPDALIAIAKATELFVQDFTQSSQRIAKTYGRKNLRHAEGKSVLEVCMKKAAKLSEFQFVDYSRLIREEAEKEDVKMADKNEMGEE